LEIWTHLLHRAVTIENMAISKTSIDVCCRFKQGWSRLFALECTASEHCEFYVSLFHSETVFRFEGLIYIADDSVNLYQNIRILISSGSIADSPASIFLMTFEERFEL
jgi:hypothetical protein